MPFKIMIGILSFLLILNSCGNHNNKISNDLYGTYTDSRDNKTYKTIIIGGQTWMADNFAYKVNSGCWANNDNENNATTYGYLYNWQTAKSICPTGWHLPSDEEWITLLNCLGGEDNAGSRLKSTSGWSSSNSANTSSGFAALPGGFRNKTGGYCDVGSNGYWWTSTWWGIMGYGGYDGRHISSNSNSAYRSPNIEEEGLSVRYIKDK